MLHAYRHLNLPHGLFLSVVLVTLSACGGGSSDTDSGTSSSPLSQPQLLALSYANPEQLLALGQTIIPIKPSDSGAPITSYRIEPALPAGLNFDTATGIISGTPTAVSAVVIYAITATNAADSATTGLALAVEAGVTPPAFISYQCNPCNLADDKPVILMTPHYLGGQPTKFITLTPLAPGLNLDSNTGVISGNPLFDIPPTAYTIVASNSAGTTTAELVLATQAPAPTGLKYDSIQFTYTVGLPIVPLSPTYSGGQIDRYSVSPALPAGMDLNTENGAISGKPSAVTAEATYTITGTDTSSGLSTQTSIELIIQALQPGCADPACDRYYASPYIWSRISNILYTYPQAKEYCETTISAKFGGRWVLPNGYHFGLSELLGGFTPEKVISKGWSTGLVWFEPQDKTKIGSYDFGTDPLTAGKTVDKLAPGTPLLVTCFLSK